MRKPIKEIENVLEKHDYSINNIICEDLQVQNNLLPSWLSKTGGLQYFGNPHAYVDVTPNVIEKCPRFIQK